MYTENKFILRLEDARRIRSSGCGFKSATLNQVYDSLNKDHIVFVSDASGEHPYLITWTVRQIIEAL